MGTPWGDRSCLLHASTCFGVGSSRGCRWVSAPMPTSYLPRDLHCRLQGNPSSDTLNTASPCFFNDLGACRAVPLKYSYSYLYLQCHCAVLPLPLNVVISEVLPLSLVGSALASSGSVLEPVGIGSVGHGRSFQHVLIAATPSASLLTNLARKPQYTWIRRLEY